MEKRALRILLADDDETDRELFEEALKKVSYTPDLARATNGEQLMDYLHQDGLILPDALFLDLNMPRKNGFECLTEIRASPVLRDIPVFIMSTSLDMDTVKQLYAEGSFHYIRKPGSFRILVDTLQRSLDILASGTYSQPAYVDFVLNDKL